MRVRLGAFRHLLFLFVSGGLKPLQVYQQPVLFTHKLLQELLGPAGTPHGVPQKAIALLLGESHDFSYFASAEAAGAPEAPFLAGAALGGLISSSSSQASGMGSTAATSP
jgi:hypothetical protein